MSDIYVNSKNHYEDITEFYTETVPGFNDYPPDYINLSGHGLSEYDMFTELGSTRTNSGLERLVQSMRNILQTPKGTRFFLPLFGSRIHELLFQPNDDILSELLQLYIKEAIDNWEPRVVIDDVIIRKLSSTSVTAEILFHAKSYGTPQSFVYSVNRDIKSID